MIYSNESVCTIVVVHNPEMLSSGNLKTESFSCIPPPRIPMINSPPPHKHNSIQSLGLGHYMKSNMRYRTITISFYDCNEEIIFVSDEIREKMPQKPNFESKEIRILGENGINSKLLHRKTHNSILSGRFGDPYGRRLFSCSGELACMIITLDN